MLKLLDPNWRRDTLYYIVDKNSNKIRHKQNKVQKKISESKARITTILKARQFGVSTEGILADLDYTMFNRNVTSVILAHENDAIEKLFRIARRAYDFMHPDVKPELHKGGGSKYEMYFPEINSRIYCDLESRGDTINRLHVSECAFMKDPNRLKSTLQAVPMNGRARIESTPNGIGNYFYELWADENSSAQKLFFPWFVHDEYKLPCAEKLIITEEEQIVIEKAKKYDLFLSDEQIMFRRFKKQELKSYDSADRVTFEQEYPEDDITCFVTSGNMVFDGLIIKKLLSEAKKPIRIINGIKIYKEHDKNHKYIIGADVSEGNGGDFSTATVICINTKEVVATYRGQIRNFDFAQTLLDLATEFSTAVSFPVVAVERNNHGHAVILQLSHNLNYPNMYRHSDEKLGWLTSALTRPNLLNTFVQAVESKLFKIDDKNILDECLTLINNNGKLEAASGKHDDCIISAAIAIKLVLEHGDLDVYTNIKNLIRI